MPCAAIPARSRSKGVPTVQISASMPRLPRQKLTLSKDLYPSPPEHPPLPQDLSQALRRHPRASHGVCGLPILDMFLCCVGCPGLPEFSPVSRATHSYSPSPPLRVAPPDRSEGRSILYRSSEERDVPVPTRGEHSMPGEVHNRQTAQNSS